ncbi:hypothetical protein MUN88_14830 [Gracilibacillus caseinilyticus]|uniref:Fur-regulated basic protein A n=1 Tax=Gracilibacillus caseinilyticus TaxID=2932256 RepID=A0ABY4ESC2_9BACI|nr:hypothetical protein [Gracilibacillus caseinilyticus]UOQ47335.1 hypothetical protein MUN88_14830 [Gracilibacillus caseinilyticus]
MRTNDNFNRHSVTEKQFLRSMQQMTEWQLRHYQTEIADQFHIPLHKTQRMPKIRK